MGCKVNFKTNGLFKEHLGSSEHREKAANNTDSNWASAASSVPFGDTIDKMLSNLRKNPNSAFDCTLCNIPCSSQQVLNTHLAGKQHKKKLELSQAAGGRFRCEVCSIEATDQAGLDMHLAGKKHIKKAAQARSA